MSSISLLDMAQIMTLMISMAEVLFFGFTLTTHKHAEPIWEPFWVTLVEVICYILQIASSSYRFEMADGAMLNVISPMAWCLACPVAMSFMMRIAWPEVSNRVTIALIMNLEAVILMGMISGMTSNWTLKISLFVFAAILYLFLITFLLRGMFYSKTKRTKEAQHIFLFFLATWMLFPIVWGLGPNMSGVWSYELTLTFFAFGDLFSKNIFTFIGYKYTMSVLEKEDQEAMKNGTHPDLEMSKKTPSKWDVLKNGTMTTGPFHLHQQHQLQKEQLEQQHQMEMDQHQQEQQQQQQQPQQHNIDPHLLSVIMHVLEAGEQKKLQGTPTTASTPLKTEEERYQLQQQQQHFGQGTNPSSMESGPNSPMSTRSVNDSPHPMRIGSSRSLNGA